MPIIRCVNCGQLIMILLTPANIYTMKNIFKAFISATFIFCCMFSSSCQNKQNENNNNNNGQQMPDTFSNPDSAAATSIHVLQTLASNEKLKGTINLSADEVKQLQVGKAIPLQEISYNELLKVNPDSITAPPVDMSQKSQMLYPLQINGAIKTTALVYGDGSQWKLSSAGDNRHVELLSMQKPDSASNVSLMDVPGLGISFLKYTINGQNFYVANRSIVSAKIEKGRAVPERQALQSLAVYAKQFDEKYGKDIKNKKIVD